MKKFSSLLIAMLLLSGSWAWAGKPVERDLRHCLDLQSNYEIAKCAGELTPWKGGKPAPQSGGMAAAGKMEAAQAEAVKPEAAKPEGTKKAQAASGNPAPKNEAEAFRPHVLVVKSHDAIASWVKLAPALRKGEAGHLKSVSRDEKIFFPVIATFSESQAGKKITLSAELELVTPDGKVNPLKPEGASGCCQASSVDAAAPQTVVLQPVQEITFEAKDLSGKYRLRAKISNGKETVVAEETFTLM